MITVFSFGISWVAYAFVFYALTLLLPQFHSTYHEVVFKIGFIIGFFDAAMLRVIRVANFKLNWVGLLLVTILVDWGLIVMTNNLTTDYTITGNMAPFLAAVLLGAFVVAFDLLKNRVLSDIRI